MKLPGFLNGRYALPLTLLLALQAAAFYSTSTPEMALEPPDFTAFPREVGSWRALADYPVEAEVQEVLRADRVLNRSYVKAGSQQAANLFIAFFRSQKTGAAPHSPKNCLPGSGWAPVEAGTLTVNVEGWPEPVTVNRYTVARGGEKTVVLYWYQTAHRVVASEYLAKIWLVLDAVRYRRSDTSLVRVTVPPGEGDEGAAEFVRDFFPAIRAALPR